MLAVALPQEKYGILSVLNLFSRESVKKPDLMSRAINQTYTCPCGEVFTSPIYEYVNVGQDPHLQYVVLAGLLNVLTCPNCGKKAAVLSPFVYSDPVHNLLAYVHPREDAPAEARHMILEQLRSVYMDIREQTEEQEQTLMDSKNGASDSIATNDIPPLQVVFGLDQLYALINSVLGLEERLGRLALSTQSRNIAERGQFLHIARKLASEMGCAYEVEDMPDEYTVWLYGSRRRIGALMRELTVR
jgi:hypothetical protein